MSASRTLCALLCSALRRGLLNIVVVSIILFTVAWNPCNVAPAANMLDMPIVALMPSATLGLVSMITLAYGKATWHLGKLKRVFLRGTLVYIFGALAWTIEEQIGLFSCPRAFTMHSVWHLTSAFSLLSWTAFLKYHRGLFFGFRPELRGYCWCPYVVWLEPEVDPERNPIIRHAHMPSRSPDDNSRLTNRRNTYVEPKCMLPVGTGSSTRIKQLWRGQSILASGALAGSTDALAPQRRSQFSHRTAPPPCSERIAAKL